MGKGGTGKSTISLLLDPCPVRTGQKMLLLIELDCGLRGLEFDAWHVRPRTVDLADILLGAVRPQRHFARGSA
jgi:MinD-like ATPase involved in chromosome partitioning or flagellar assembly